MHRDELDTTADSNHHKYNGSVGMFYQLTTNSSERVLLKELPTLEKLSPTTLSFEERYKLEQEEFYKTYNPNVGFNTAAVLAGMLVLLVIYVIYRTKCRKFIIRQCNNLFKKDKELIPPEAMKFTFDDVDADAEDIHDKFDNPGIGSDDASCIQYGSAGTNHSFSTGNRTPVPNLPHQFSLNENAQKIYREVPTLTISNEDKRLPVVVMDMKSATADWVQKQYQFLDPGGIILKVKSDTICPLGNEIYPSTSAATKPRGTCANSHQCLSSKVKQYDSASRCTLNLNNSLPVLEIPETSFLNANQSTLYKKRTDYKTRKFPSVSSEPKSPFHPPMHITPIIKIQNFDKSQRKLSTSRVKDSRDSVSSSSSDDPLIYRIPEDEWNTPPVQRRSVVSEQGDNLSACIACALGQVTPTQSPLRKSDSSTRPKLPQKQQSLTIPVIRYPSQRSLSRCHTIETPL